jgi:hypothetical protein
LNNNYEKFNDPIFEKIERREKFLSNNDRNVMGTIEKNSFLEKQHYSLERVLEREKNKYSKFDKYEKLPEKYGKFEMFGNKIENPNRIQERNELKSLDKYEQIRQSYLPQNVLMPKLNKGYGGGFGTNHTNLLNKLEYKEKAIFSMPPIGRGF